MGSLRDPNVHEDIELFVHLDLLISMIESVLSDDWEGRSHIAIDDGITDMVINNCVLDRLVGLELGKSCEKKLIFQTCLLDLL